MNEYIDAKELRKAYRDWFDTYDWHHNGKDYEKSTIAKAVQILDKQPAADVIPVEWIKEQKDKCFSRSAALVLSNLIIEWRKENNDK